MRGAIGIVLTGLAMLAGSPAAYADGGRITFSGAVVEPTCFVKDVDAGMLLPPVAGTAPRRVTCGRTANERGSSYSRTVIHLDTVDVSNDRLLDYFVSRDQTANALLVVRTYE